jgi:hypothetical protein
MVGVILPAVERSLISITVSTPLNDSLKPSLVPLALSIYHEHIKTPEREGKAWELGEVRRSSSDKIRKPVVFNLL